VARPRRSKQKNWSNRARKANQREQARRRASGHKGSSTRRMAGSKPLDFVEPAPPSAWALMRQAELVARQGDADPVRGLVLRGWLGDDEDRSARQIVRAWRAVVRPVDLRNSGGGSDLSEGETEYRWRLWRLWSDACASVGWSASEIVEMLEGDRPPRSGLRDRVRDWRWCREALGATAATAATAA